MRTWIVGSLALVLTIGILPAQAVEPLALYDDFHGTQLDPAKWVGEQGLPLLDTAREVVSNRLHLSARSYGSPSVSSPRWRVAFIQSSAVTAIEATLQVTGAEAVGCDGNAEPARAQARLSGYFFNASPTGSSNGRTDDVFAFVRVQRFSDSTDPEHVLQIVGFVLHCRNSDCSATDTLGDVNLGTVNLWQSVRLRIQWDQANHRFIFQRDRHAEVYVAYTVSDTSPSSFSGKRIELAHEVPACATAPRADVSMEVLIDKVLVNESAVPLP